MNCSTPIKTISFYPKNQTILIERNLQEGCDLNPTKKGLEIKLTKETTNKIILFIKKLLGLISELQINQQIFHVSKDQIQAIESYFTISDNQTRLTSENRHQLTMAEESNRRKMILTVKENKLSQDSRGLKIFELLNNLPTAPQVEVRSFFQKHCSVM